MRHKPIEHNGRILITRVAAGYFLKRHPDLIRRHGNPVACIVASRAVLYDLDELEVVFRDTPRRRLLSDCA